MACLLVPAAEAVITTIIAKAIKSKEKEEKVKSLYKSEFEENVTKISFSTKLGWLNKLLWGGSSLLAFEHVWHGEIIPFFPFLTAVETGETAEMLAEMGSAGTAMALIVTAVWCCMLGASAIIEKRVFSTPKLVKENI